jgi:hypothetical protein
MRNGISGASSRAHGREVCWGERGKGRVYAQAPLSHYRRVPDGARREGSAAYSRSPAASKASARSSPE